MYLAALAVSIPILWIVGEENSRSYRVFLFLPQTAAQWAQNLTFVYWAAFPWDIQPRISPPTWALTVELLYYICIGLGVSRSRRLTFFWLLSSVFVTCFLWTRVDGERFLEGHLLAGSLPFAIGSAAFHWRQELLDIGAKICPRGNWIFWSCGIFALSVGLTGLGKLFAPLESLIFAGHIVNLILGCGVVVRLSSLRASNHFERRDRSIGDYTFPIYLLHWQIGLAVSMLLFRRPVLGFHLQGITAYLLAIAGTIGVSWLLIRFVDTPLQGLRKRLRRAPAE